MEEIKIKKKNLVMFLALIVILPAVIIFSIYFFQPGVSVKDQPSSDLSGLSLEAKFEVLSSAKTNFCAGPDILERVNAESLQGSCCSKMDFHRYEEQVEGLKKYAEYEIIPSDPYDISRELAEELLDYQKNIVLTEEQQIIYNEAMDMSMEGGPCCCKCWRWYAFEGQAKYLITEYDFTAEQIAEVWDLEDGCGGSGHLHGGGHTGHGGAVEREVFEPEI